MKTRAAASALALVAALVADARAATVPQDDAYVAFPAAGVKLRRPKGFVDAENFVGFQDAKTGASVMITTLDAPYAMTARPMSKVGPTSHGFEILASEPATFDGATGLLAKISQEAQGVRFLKWAAVFGDERRTTQILATFPVAAEAAVSEELKAILLAVVRTATGAPTPNEEAAFTIDPPVGFEPGPRVGRGVLFLGKAPAKGGPVPLFAAAPSLGPSPTGSRSALARRRLETLASIVLGGDADVVEQPVSIDGLQGVELVAPAKDAKSKEPVVVHQTMLFADDGYFVLVGIGDPASDAKAVEAFRKAAATFRRRSVAAGSRPATSSAPASRPLPAPAPAKDDDVGFEIAPPPGLVRVAATPAVLYAKVAAGGRSRESFSVQRQTTPVPPTLRARAGRDYAGSAPGVKDLRRVEESAVEIDGLKGTEVVSDGVDAASGLPVVVVCVLLFEDAGLYVIKGAADAADRAASLAALRAAARSFRRKAP